MKINGKKLDTPNEEILVLERLDQETGEKYPLVIRARAIMDSSVFEELCPPPKPPMRILPGRIKEEDRDDKTFQKELEQWGKKKTGWMIVTSLSATEGLEWETVDLQKPDTYLNYEKELKDSHFSENEIQRIMIMVMDANSLNEDKLKKARELFLRTREAELKS